MLEQKLHKTRKDLLDLTARNRLLNTPRNSSRSTRLEVVDELATEVFRILVTEKRKMSFLGDPCKNKSEDAESDSSELIALAQPEENDLTDENGVAERHVDDQLQTSFSDENLQKKLLKLSYDARATEEEQGVNTLYLAIGFLRWFEAKSSSVERQAPLILIPVTLERTSANAKFKLAWDENDINTNLSLQQKLNDEFGVRLPEIGDVEDFSPSEYFQQVQEAISNKPEWNIDADSMVLWFFSFAKFLMYKDLDPNCWPENRSLEDHNLIHGLLGTGFSTDPPICPEDQNIDEVLNPKDLVHVVDADSSQTLAIEEAKTGRNMVIQGPPGTGKSQTITNIIAAAVSDGKKVLFVAEKMAALQVVHRRLDSIGLGPLCFELHSHKANKKTVLKELETTLTLGKPKQDNNDQHADELAACRDRLNRHVKAMHSRLSPCCISPYQILGQLVRLQQKGIATPEFELPNSGQWSREDFRNNLGLIEDLKIHLEKIGIPAKHQWNGCETSALLPADQDRIQKQIRTVSEQLEVLLNANKTIASLFETSIPVTLVDTVEIANIGRAASKAPHGVTEESITADTWQHQLETITNAVESAKILRDLNQSLEAVVSDVAWETNLAETRRAIKAHGKSWFKFLNSSYRQAKANLLGVLNSDLPSSVEEQILLIDQIREAQKLTAEQKETNTLLERSFGNLWSNEKSDFKLLRKVCEWHQSCSSLNLPHGFVSAAANNQVREEIADATTTIRNNINELARGLKELFENLQLNLEVSLGQKDVKAIPLTALSTKLNSWVGQDEALSQWISFSLRLQKLTQNGMESLANFIHRGAVTHENAADQFESVYYENLMRIAFREFPSLGEFDGESHEHVMERFCELDMERREYARRQVAAQHYDMLPKHGAQSGEIGIVRREMAKKSRHMPIRKLLSSAGHAIQAIKPVFMMSPISVAQFLEPGILEFDLLLIDEASQVKPVDALGSIARSKQVIVVGDEKQLPPTNFFSKMSGDDEEAVGPEDFNAKDIESILGLCSAQGINQRMLKWHYRSRHQSLIAVSNHEFYESKLFVVPSPSKISQTLGLSFVHVKDGVFDRGKSRTNKLEAEQVAEAVIQHAQDFPDKTLGVAAFSVAQRDAILNQIEYRRRNHPELEEFFAAGGPEPFFVKNIENVQGDERDTIMISVGYGKDSSGYMPMSFGPLQNDGGERRLNVLISRAKEKCIVFSSITPDDIDLNRAKSRGVAAFKTFLTYARSGYLDVGVVASERGFDSEFEIQVASALTGLGYDVKSQIGVAGFFVDLAIVDPERPGRYLIGIECDGASYHSSRSARDRDRIRQAVLEDRGWIIHRIWSTDWFLRPEEQLKRVVEAVEQAKCEWGARDQGRPSEDGPANDSISFAVEREIAPDISIEGATAIETVPYKEAEFSVNTSMEIHELKPVELGRVVEGIVKVESPVHTSEISRRVATLWDLNRAGSRITKCVEKAVDHMVRNRALKCSEGYVTIPDAPIPIRSRESVQSSNLRKPEMLPPAEIQKAILAVVEVNHGVSSEELIKEISLLLGFKQAREKLREALGKQVEKAINRGNIESRNGNLYLSEKCTKHLKIGSPAG